MTSDFHQPPCSRAELDARWCAARDARALGEEPEHPLAAGPAAGPATELTAGLEQAWAREDTFYAALEREATGAEAPELTDHDLAWVGAVLDQHANAPSEPLVGETTEAYEVVPPRRRGVVRSFVAVLAVAAALVLSWVALTPELGLRGSQGTWVTHESQRLDKGEPLPMAVWLVAEDAACGELDGASVCARQGTVMRLHPGKGRRVEIEVRDGELTVDGDLEIRTAAGHLRGYETSTYWVRVSAEQRVVEVEVEHGTLELLEPRGPRTLDAGKRVRLETEPSGVGLPHMPPEPRSEAELEVEREPEPSSAPTRARPSARTHAKPSLSEPPSPGELLVQARTRLGEGDARGAAKAYAALIEAHPGGAEAQAARVSLGQLRLAAGRPKAALGLFTRYLEHGGPLAQEALWGKIQATAALGRRQALETAVDELVRRFPGSVYRTRAQALLHP